LVYYFVFQNLCISTRPSPVTALLKYYQLVSHRLFSVLWNIKSKTMGGIGSYQRDGRASRRVGRELPQTLHGI